MLVGQRSTVAKYFARPDESKGLCTFGAPFAVDPHGALHHIVEVAGRIVLSIDDFVFREDVFALCSEEPRALLGGEGFAKGVRNQIRRPRVLDYHLLHNVSLSEVVD